MSEPEVGAEAVEHVAALARIELTDEQVERLRADFAEILGYFDRLEEVPDVERQPERVNVVRPDEPTDSLDQEEALANAEETEDGYFKGPSVS